MDNIIFKFTWPKPAGFEPLELIIAGNDLKARDPEGTEIEESDRRQAAQPGQQGLEA